MTDKASSQELAHYGVKGMKWGYRKARTGGLQRRSARLDRVASGKGGIRDNVAVLATTNPLAVAASRGYKNDVKRRSNNHKAAVERLATGKAKVSDILKAYGTVTPVGLVRSMGKD